VTSIFVLLRAVDKRTEGLPNNVYEHIPYFEYNGATAIGEITSY